MIPGFARLEPGDAPERMDEPEADPSALECALDTIALVNRRLGGLNAVQRTMQRALAGRAPGPVRILDVGTGSGDIPVRLDHVLSGGGWRARFVLADLHPTTLRIARRRTRTRTAERPGASFRFVRLTAAELPFVGGAFDLGFSATMLHHLPFAEAVRFLRELDRVTAGRWFVTDLRRSRLAYLGARLLAATLWRRDALSRADGPVSIRRAFVPREAERLLSAAGVRGTVRAVPPIRLAIDGSGIPARGVEPGRAGA